jgi:hypothetical protein
MAKKVYYYENSFGKKIYENTTAADRKMMRDCHNRRVPLMAEQKIQIFGDPNPIFVKRF